MKKLLLLLLCSPIPLMGQIFKSSNQQIVESAIQDGFIIIKESYQLEDTVSRQRYGRFGNEEFGETISLGIKMRNGVLLNDKVVHPWDYDENFERYRESHKPIHFKTEYMEFNNLTYNPITIRFDSLTVQNDKITFSENSTFRGKGFEQIDLNEKREGWIVWISGKSKIEECDSISNPIYITYREVIDFSEDLQKYVIEKPQTDSEIWGGIFIVPEQTQIGQITFKLVGTLLYDFAENEWALYPLKINEPTEMKLEETGEELTPLNNPEESLTDTKKKKNKDR